MSITDELRKWARNRVAEFSIGGVSGNDLNTIADRIEVEYAAYRAAVDAIPKEYVKLPVDADGVPIRVGDEMEVCSTCSIEVIGVGNVTEDDGTYGVFCQREDGCYEWFNARFLHHHQPDSWERIIQDAVKLGYADYPTTSYEAELVERCRRLARQEQ